MSGESRADYKLAWTQYPYDDPRYICLAWTAVFDVPPLITPFGEITSIHRPVLFYLSGLN